MIVNPRKFFLDCVIQFLFNDRKRLLVFWTRGSTVWYRWIKCSCRQIVTPGLLTKRDHFPNLPVRMFNAFSLYILFRVLSFNPNP